MVHATAPTEPPLTAASSRMRSQVPYAVQRRRRSCPVFHAPYRSGRSRHGAPVRRGHGIALITTGDYARAGLPVTAGSSGAIRSHA